MQKRLGALVALSAVVAVVTVACSDSSRSVTAPMASGPVANQKLLGGLISTVTDLLVAPAQRTTPLATDVSWTFTAGPGGAISSNSDVGLTIFVPAGALSSAQTITVTALAGAPVAYRFEPHQVFSKKVSLTQNLRGVDVGLLGSVVMSGAHFDGDALALDADGLATVTETVPALVSLFTRTATFRVGHFTGWILASGRSDDDGGF